MFVNLFAFCMVVVATLFKKSEAGLEEMQVSRALITLMVVLPFNCVVGNKVCGNF